MSSLRSHRGRLTVAADRAAYGALMEDVLGLASLEPPDDSWVPVALFDDGGRCVAAIEAAVLPLVVAGDRTSATGIRSVAVAPSWRGRGLFRALMSDVLAWSAAQSDGPALLYTETPDLYGRFGFRLLPQHAFLAPPPSPYAAETARRLDPRRRQDRALITQIVEARTPVSLDVALEVGLPLYMANLKKSDAPSISILPGHEIIVVHEDDGDTLVIADVVGADIPPLAVLLGALRLRPRRVKTLFSPDRLKWQGLPVPEDTGLMARGPVPAAMTRPFMFPPTVEF